MNTENKYTIILIKLKFTNPISEVKKKNKRNMPAIMENNVRITILTNTSLQVHY